MLQGLPPQLPPPFSQPPLPPPLPLLQQPQPQPQQQQLGKRTFGGGDGGSAAQLLEGALRVAEEAARAANLPSPVVAAQALLAQLMPPAGGRSSRGGSGSSGGSGSGGSGSGGEGAREAR